MGKHGHFKNRNRKIRGTGTKGSGTHYGLKFRQKSFDEIVDHKTPTRVTAHGHYYTFARPGCKGTSGYHRPGSNKK